MKTSANLGDKRRGKREEELGRYIEIFLPAEDS